MKKIILLILMLSPFANADMDNVCVINLDDGLDILQDDGVMAKMIDSKGCERNNILWLSLPDEFDITLNL